MDCAVCGHPVTDDAHVKDKAEFEGDQNDRINNIINLCPTHHRMFDDGKIGICPNKEHLLVKEDTKIEKIKPMSPIHMITNQYIKYNNNKCDLDIRAKLGVVPGMSWDSVCGE
jgi:predicted restriction endonuclease